MEDQLIWSLTPHGQFTTSSAYRLLDSDLPCSSNANFLYGECEWSNFWKLKWIHPKIMIFIWRALNDAISTRNKLKLWKPNFDSCCPFCLFEEESVDHLFLFCPIAKAVWFGSDLGARFDLFKHFPELMISFWISLGSAYLSSPHPSYPLAFSIIWHLWLAHNVVIFCGVVWPPELVICKARE
uniref:Reverse transcriptase zinc-binding domain-containing protein n=1 Tax=Nelumbo nucifera TaxID=4432 RepID=A0A822ZVW8_NELNU|nr:TPA_asm: hypothetical protein HUJ06_018577 [Nelumbo nucifera]